MIRTRNPHVTARCRHARRGRAAVALAGCNTPPAYQVSEHAGCPHRHRGVDPEHTVQNVRNAVGAIGGALIGGGLGSLIGGGTGKTVATVVGAVGGGFVGNEVASRPDAGVGHRRPLRRRHRTPSPADRRAGVADRRSRSRHADRDRVAPLSVEAPCSITSSSASTAPCAHLAGIAAAPGRCPVPLARRRARPRKSGATRPG